MKKNVQNVLQFSGYIICLAVLVSCSKSLTGTSSVNPDHSVRIDSSLVQRDPIPVARPIAIDTLVNPFESKGPLSLENQHDRQRINDKVVRFYNIKGFETQWLFDSAPGNLYYTAIDMLKNAATFGLNPRDYDVGGIEERLRSLYQPKENKTIDIVALDIHITEMYFLFTTHLMEGKVRNVGSNRYVWKRPAQQYSTRDVDLLAGVSNPDELLGTVKTLQPASEQYTRLQMALEQYRRLESETPDAFPVITVNGKVKPGDRNIAIPLVRKKLSFTDLKPYPMQYDSSLESMDSLVYDQTLADAVKFFQLRHGLEPDGIIGEKTLKFLNQSFHEKANIIALNMERMRWTTENSAQNYILVNIPEYKLRVYENKKVQFEMRVIVGAANKATPVFSDALEHLVFSPTWTVPVSIIKEEIIPNLRSNPAYYSAKNFSFYKNDVEIDPSLEDWNSETVNPYQYRVVQGPGRDNSLGLVKFVMPNTMSVYLHDTPNHRLFARDYRALSHGCVRLDEPVRFAEYLLRDQKGWTPERINKAMNDSIPSTVHLKKPFDVHLEYWTAWVDEDGLVNFREDIYGHDKVQLSQLLPVEKATSTFLGM